MDLVFFDGKITFSEYLILILIGGVVYGIWKIIFEDKVKHNRLIRKAV
jgi:hypothetical protein